jgi:putative nucleotidyltransferase with HDIG domain
VTARAGADAHTAHGRPAGGRLPSPAQAVHLVRRFAGSLWPGGPSGADEAWVVGLLTPAEEALWRGMPGYDRRHAVGVARRTADALGPRATRPVLAAALLHDIGKLDSGLGPIGRAAATMAALVWGQPTAAGWRARRGPAGRAGRYLSHDVLGAEMLAAAGSDGLIVTWAREHHLSPERWSVPADIGAALKLADDD